MPLSSSNLPAQRFLERAHLEAARYGSDPWIFVRELLQTARDAGASRISFEAKSDSGQERLSCRDDGEGMSFAHARRFLFPLYASSKDGRGGAAGRFGVGFWAVLRFQPSRIIVRSWPRDGEAWEVSLDGGLADGLTGVPPPAAGHGTEVVLERRARGDRLAGLVTEAVRHGTRDLRQRDAPRRGVVITVNRTLVRSPFELKAPSASFRKGRLKGVVGLGSEPRALLFSKGLRLRDAAYLHDLLVSATTSRTPRLGEGPSGREGLAPQALLEGASLEPLLARTDVHESRDLRKLVRLAQGETERLIRRQLDHDRPRTAWQRAADAIREVPPMAGLLLLASAVTATALLWAGRRWAPRTDVPVAARSPAHIPSSTGAYRDLARLYGGPDVEALDRSYRPIDLRYAPAQDELRFAALIVDRIEPDGRRRRHAAGEARPWPTVSRSACHAGCTSVAITVDDGPGLLRIPVATGFRLDPASVTLDESPQGVYSSPEGQPALQLESRSTGTLHYMIQRALPEVPEHSPQPPLELPPELASLAHRLRTRPISERAAGASDWIRQRIRYSQSPEVVALYRTSRAPLAWRALAIGAGDCDVQNGVLMLVLQAARVPSRLAVGYLGTQGRVAPWLHAWVEFQGDSGTWEVADASQPTTHPASGLASVNPPPPVRLQPGIGATPPDSGARDPGSLAPSSSLERPTRRLTAWLLGVLTVLAGVIALLLGRTRRTVRIDDRHELSRLLQGALQHPEAFRDVPAVFHRGLVPLARAAPASLAEVWHLASKGRLYRTRTACPLARQAAGRGLRVVDTRSDAGRVVADALGAVDLDAWQALLGRSRLTPLLESAAAQLARFGEPLELRVVRGDDSPPTQLLELPADRRRLFGRPQRWLVVDAATRWLSEAERLWASRPAEALFDVVDRVVDLIELGEAGRVRLLAPLARAALRGGHR